jgi:molybdopterin-synthase adenylyltransferase
MKVPFISHRKEERYARQEPLIGKGGQRRLGKSRIAIVGLGALGSVVCQAMARAGVGHITLIDRDIVEPENLQSQIIYAEKDIGQPKAMICRKRMLLANPHIKATAHAIDLIPSTVADAIGKKDLVIDCTDNIPTRLLINDYCLKRKISWVHGAAIAARGHVALFTNGKNEPCYRCVFGDKQSEETCDTAGILVSTTAVIGGLTSQLALQELLGRKNPLPASMLRANLEDFSSSLYAINRNPQCKSCVKKEFPALTEKRPEAIKLCGSTCFQILGKKHDLKKMKERLERHGKVDDFLVCLRFKEITVFEDGRVLVHTGSKEEAVALFEKYITP